MSTSSHIKLISMKVSPSDITPRLLSPRPLTSAVKVGVREVRSGIDVLAHLKQMKTVKADRFPFLIVPVDRPGARSNEVVWSATSRRI